MKTWIFDMDGTLSDSSPRKHYLERPKKDWNAWNAEMHLDSANEDIAQFARIAREKGIKVVICTGREDAFMSVTTHWLNHKNIPFDAIYMRKTKDYRDDSIVKKELYHQMVSDGYQPELAFDDRDRVVQAWREVGLRCFQVAPGNF